MSPIADAARVLTSLAGLVNHFAAVNEDGEFTFTAPEKFSAQNITATVTSLSGSGVIIGAYALREAKFQYDSRYMSSAQKANLRSLNDSTGRGNRILWAISIVECLELLLGHGV